VGGGGRPGLRGLAIRICVLQGLPRRPLRCVPGRTLPRGTSRARRAVLHAGRVERRAPASIVVLGELEIEALTVVRGNRA